MEIRFWAAFLFLVLSWSAGTSAQWGSLCPPGSQPVAGGGGMMCMCPDGSYANYGQACAPRCPLGTQNCGGQCCNQGFYCSRYGCIQQGSIECGGHSCSPGTQCSSGGHCIPAGADDCGEGRHCSGGKVCWTSPWNYGGYQRDAQYCVSPAERVRINQEIGRAKLDAKQRAKEAVEARNRARNASFDTASVRSVAGRIPKAGGKATQSEWTGFAELRNGQLPKPDSAIGYGYCTDYVRGVYQQSGAPLPFSGNASAWLNNSRQYPDKFILLDAAQIDRVPAGAIAVWGNKTDSSKAGHVAIVRSNNPAAKAITFSESNLGGAYPKGNLTPEQQTYLENEFITANFNKVTEAHKSYGTAISRAANPKNHDMDLLGFIVPK